MSKTWQLYSSQLRVRELLLVTGAGIGIQNCGCKITFMSSSGKFVGSDLQNFRGVKGHFQKSVGAGAPTLTQSLHNV